MNLFKQILKMVTGLAIGCLAGFAIGALISVAVTDTTFPEYVEKLTSTRMQEILIAVLVGACGFISAVMILIPIHEAGHLIAGLATGYKFVSFRIFDITFIKSCGKTRVKRFSIAGTGGQCLMSPPDLPLEKIPVGWYNAGGVLANIATGLLMAPLLCFNLNPFLFEFICIFLLVDVIMILMNGIPLKISGIGNDGYNMLHLHNDLKAKRGIIIQLKSNALIQQGVRPREMPAEWFETSGTTDWKNPLEVSVPLMHASLQLDRLLIDEAMREFQILYSHRSEIMPLYVNEIAAELAFCAMATDATAYAQEILDTGLRKYIESYAKVMSGKQRLLFAIALYIDNDRNKATSIYSELEKNRDRYLLQGEVNSDLAIMRYLLHG